MCSTTTGQPTPPSSSPWLPSAFSRSRSGYGGSTRSFTRNSRHTIGKIRPRSCLPDSSGVRSADWLSSPGSRRLLDPEPSQHMCAERYPRLGKALLERFSAPTEEVPFRPLPSQFRMREWHPSAENRDRSSLGIVQWTILTFCLRLRDCPHPVRIPRSPSRYSTRRRSDVIPYAAMSETSSNCWKFSVINEASCWEYLVDKPSRTSWMAA